MALTAVSSSKILRKVLGNEADSLLWRREVCKARSRKLPIVILQMIIRAEELRGSEASPLLKLLPNGQEWEATLDSACRAGRTRKQLEEYARVLDAKTDDERCTRFLEAGSNAPMALFTFLVRPSSKITKITTLNALIESSQAYYDARLQEKRSGMADVMNISEMSLKMSQSKYSLVMSLLTQQCLRLEPRLLVKLAVMATRYIQNIATYSGDPREVFVAQCEVFNRSLGLFRPRPEAQSIQKALPNAYLWEAQRILLAMSEGHEKPLLLDRGGFRSIRDVLAGQPKNQTEVHSSARHVPSWPPYLRPADGMDERSDPEENWSRTVSAGMLMQEAGFAKDEFDEALDILQGMSANGSPTIQQRVLRGRGRDIGVWEASIRATRNAQEAWERFQNPPEAGAKAGPEEYAAMFEKLVLREAEAGGRILPGDRALNFTTHHETNLAEFERARRRPPSVGQLYQQMRLSGIKLHGSCLRILVANAESLDTAYRYIRESRGGGRIARALTAGAAEPEGLQAVPLGLFAAYVQVCSRTEGKRGGRKLMRVIHLASTRLESAPSRWAAHIWGLILKNLSQHHRALRMSFSEQMDMFVRVAERIHESHGLSLPTFVQFAKCIRKATRREMARVLTDLQHNESAGRDSLRRLYEQQTADPTATTAQGRTSAGSAARTPLFLLRTAASRIKEMWEELADQEKGRQEIVGVCEVPALERMSSRTDAVRSDHAHEYMVALAFVGEFGEMASMLEWLVAQWGVEDVVEAMRGLDEPPHYGDFLETLCAFRLLAEPMLDEAVVEPLRAAVAGARLGWTWPDDEAVAAYAAMQDESIGRLRRVLDWTRHRQREAEREAEHEAGG